MEKLHRMGLSVDESRIVTSGQATIEYLKRNFPGKRVFLLGNELLTREFEEAGICLSESDPQVVVTGFDTSLTYGKMCRVCDLVRSGLPYIATHPDYNCPTENGFIPDAGAIHAFIHASAFRYPDHVVGKPGGDIMDYLAGRAGASREQTAMVGGQALHGRGGRSQQRIYRDSGAQRRGGNERCGGIGDCAGSHFHLGEGNDSVL